ncbi:uncharacterized protein [Lolium perenne]|uniref:uncharacterized protein n=1 Tax=Lolium perenne TaxID=4522 RepID=UPI0021EA03DA|nr:uncharacterized protein LOC127315215 [Lolium perenne]
MAVAGVAATSCRCSSVVFVGNIPYQASEKELRDACEEIGPVVSLRVGVSRHQQQQQHAGDPNLPVGVEDATHAASLVAGSAPNDAVTRYLAGMSRRQLREFLDAVAREDVGVVERAKRAFRGLATLIEQARILVEDMGAGDAGAPDKRPGGLEESGQGAPAAKVRKVDDGASVIAAVCR